MPRYARSIEISAPPDKVFEFHADPNNLVRIAPEGTKTSLISATDSRLKLGSRVKVHSLQAGMPITMEAEVIEIQSPSVLRDRQVHGPFAKWIHTHRFEPIPGGTRLTDEIEYSLPLGPLGGFMMGRIVAREIEEMFTHRQNITREILEAAPPEG